MDQNEKNYMYRLTGVVPRDHPKRLDNLLLGRAHVIAIESEQLSSETDR